MTGARGPRTAWYVVCGVLFIVLLVLLGIAFWPRPATTAAPTPQPSTTPTPVQTATPTPTQAPTPTPSPTPSPAPSPTPAQPATTPPVPDNLPAPILDHWDRNSSVWEGNPPPVVFKALFKHGDPGYLPTIGNYKIAASESITDQAGITATYVGKNHGDRWALNVDTSPLTYGDRVNRFADLQARDFAMCGQFSEGRPACMAAAENVFIRVRYQGEPGTKTYDDALSILGPIITHYANN